MKKMLGIFVVFFVLSISSPLWAGNQTADPRFIMVKIPEDSIPCTAILQSELESIYSKYNHAAESGNFEEFQKYMVEYNATLNKKSLEKLSKEELKEKKKWLQGLASKNFSVQACLMSPSTETAALAGTSMDLWQGKLVDGRGAILFKKEGNFWKVQMVGWTPNLLSQQIAPPVKPVCQAQSDARFLNDTKKNEYIICLSQAIKKAFSKEKLAFTDLRLPCLVGQDTHVVSFSLALAGIKKAPVEKDLQNLNEFLEPFLEEQRQGYNAKGYDQIIKESAFMFPKYAKDYAKDELPTIQYKLWQWKDPRESKLFYMKVTFVERRENHLVVDFTIVARE